ncbi:MAG: hypothetical protein MUO67_05665 [Anaerolineales bacterium]|nr:hypothetical protein [Anaerolineales bacterium]
MVAVLGSAGGGASVGSGGTSVGSAGGGSSGGSSAGTSGASVGSAAASVGAAGASVGAAGWQDANSMAIATNRTNHLYLDIESSSGGLWRPLGLVNSKGR